MQKAEKPIKKLEELFKTVSINNMRAMLSTAGAEYEIVEALEILKELPFATVSSYVNPVSNMALSYMLAKNMADLREAEEKRNKDKVRVAAFEEKVGLLN